uniref:Glycoprotein n=1 Tax=Drosophila immigrans sigmavirus TaxID=1002360 RepID=A0A140D8M1_9RHAB|nr:glycoprotein [Drosophila immigrans sigmavirus]
MFRGYIVALLPFVVAGVFLPEFDKNSLRPAVIHTLTCPAFIPERPNFNYDQRNNQDVTLFKPKPDFQKVVDGVVCTKIELTTQSEDFLLSSCRIVRSQRELPLSQSECDLAIAKYQRGDFLDTNYPVPDCSGYSKHIQEKVFVTVKYHSVKFDPYTMMFLDSIFSEGKTPFAYSTTAHESTLWKMTGSKPPCSEFEEIQGELMFSVNSTFSRGQDIHLWALGIQEQTFENACKVNFCGLPGALFPNGEWFNLRDDPKSGNTSTVTERLDPCVGDIEVKTESADQELQNMFTNSYQTSMRLWCLDTLEDLNSGIPIPHYRLSFLIPNAVGLGPVYKIINQTLFTTIGHYKSVTLNKLTQLNVIGTIGNGSDFVISPDQLTPTGHDNTFDWVNGLMYSNGKWSVPIVDVLRNNIHHLLSRPLNLSTIRHTMANSVLPSISMNSDEILTIHQSNDKSSRGNWITSYIHNMHTTATLIIQIITGLFILIVVGVVIRVIVWSRVFKLCKRQSSGKSKHSQNENRIIRYIGEPLGSHSAADLETSGRVVWN